MDYSDHTTAMWSYPRSSTQTFHRSSRPIYVFKRVSEGKIIPHPQCLGHWPAVWAPFRTVSIPNGSKAWRTTWCGHGRSHQTCIDIAASNLQHSTPGLCTGQPRDLLRHPLNSGKRTQMELEVRAKLICSTLCQSNWRQKDRSRATCRAAWWVGWEVMSYAKRPVLLMHLLQRPAAWIRAWETKGRSVAPCTPWGMHQRNSTSDRISSSRAFHAWSHGVGQRKHIALNKMLGASSKLPPSSCARTCVFLAPGWSVLHDQYSVKNTPESHSVTASQIKSVHSSPKLWKRPMTAPSANHTGTFNNVTHSSGLSHSPGVNYCGRKSPHHLVRRAGAWPTHMPHGVKNTYTGKSMPSRAWRSQRHPWPSGNPVRRWIGASRSNVPAPTMVIFPQPQPSGRPFLKHSLSVRGQRSDSNTPNQDWDPKTRKPTQSWATVAAAASTYRPFGRWARTILLRIFSPRPRRGRRKGRVPEIQFLTRQGRKTLAKCGPRVWLEDVRNRAADHGACCVALPYFSDPVAAPACSPGTAHVSNT